MNAHIHPSLCSGSVHIPPSKSMAHRAIICAALANGTSTITNVAYSQDIKTTIEGMRLLGAKIETKEDSVIVQGISDFNQLKHNEIPCSESGSTLRFFIPIFSLCNQLITFQGEERLLQRPQAIYEDIFHKQQKTFLQTNDGIQIKEALSAGEYTIQGDVSSQFISGLLFTLPLLDGDSILHISAPYESRSYVDLTLTMLKSFGVQATYQDDLTLFIPGNQTYKPYDYKIEGDYSQLAFFAVLAAIQHDLSITGVLHDSKQGDKEIIKILTSFGVKIETIENGYNIYKSDLHGTAIDLSNCPDLGPILTVLGMYSPGNTHIYNAERLRIKESDRIDAMQTELKKFGVDIHCTQGDIYITGKPSYTCTSELDAHNDHRIVMALSIATICSQSDTIIQGAQAISKSYPTFFEDLQKINGKVMLYDRQK